MQHNGSMWADVFLVKDGASPDPNDAKFDPNSVHQIRSRTCIYSLLCHCLLKVNCSLDPLHPKDEGQKGEKSP